MGAADCSYHYCATYDFIWKPLKWWRKLFFWCLKVLSVNSYILYCSQKAQMRLKPMPHAGCQRALAGNPAGDVSNLMRSHQE